MQILLISAVHVVSTTTTTTTTTTTIDDDSPGVVVEAPAEPAPPVQSPAETPPLAAPAATRRGLWAAVAFGPGRGFDTKDDCTEDGCGALAFELGYSIGDLWSVVLGSAVLTDFDRRAHHAETLGVRRSISPHTWAEVGAGAGSRRGYSDGSMQGGLDLAAQIAFGYEPFVGAHHALGITARIASSADVEHTGFVQVALGSTWF